MSSPYLSSFPITPFNEDGIVDTTGLRVLIKRCLDAKVPSIGVLGSTGSYPYLTSTERRKAVAAAVEEVDGRAEVLAGIGALCTREVIQLARDAKEVGANAGLLAVRMLGCEDLELRRKMQEFMRRQETEARATPAPCRPLCGWCVAARYGEFA